MNAVLDVVIVGAGPAGLMAAEVLAAGGHAVLVVEEHPEVGYPVHCTGLLGLEAFDELGLPRDTILHVARSAVFHTREGAPLLVDGDQIQAAVIDRGAFDAALAARAERAGASLRSGVVVQRIENGPDGVSIHTDGQEGPIAARACILACGANYRFHRALGLGVPRHFVETAQIEVPFPFDPHVEVLFGRNVAPGGFAWRVPFSRGGVPCARLGLMADGRALQRFQVYVAEIAHKHGVDPTTLPPPRHRMVPLWPVAKTYTDRVLAVGDAAGLVKPTTGAGIYYALLSGRWAGQALGEALRHDVLTADRLRSYEDEWGRQLGPEIRAGLAFRAIWTRLDDRAILTLLNLARVDGIGPLLRATADLRRIVLESFLS